MVEKLPQLLQDEPTFDKINLPEDEFMGNLNRENAPEEMWVDRVPDIINTGGENVFAGKSEAPTADRY